MRKVRVRFAPSPTGGLHLGGVRTALYNYLFAKKHDGDFVLRVEDTDQTRFVEGAEKYIIDCLAWCGIAPDEGLHRPGNFGPYRQSERKDLYKKFAEQLVESGHAYHAFDTPLEIEELRERLKAKGESNLQYGHQNRLEMRNSLSLSDEETKALFKTDLPHVVRIKINPGEHVRFKDMIRGDIEMDTNGVDDKVLLKADGMPTYHLAVVVDDYLMKITHAFRGEEWLPSAPVHVLLWKYLGWEKDMPEWAHLPLILKPEGNGKLSKRDGQRLGFPVFPLAWKDPVSNEILPGFKELGFLPDAFINMLAMLGWASGMEQEIFSLEELIENFSIEKVHSSGAKFDFEKAKWFNHEWIKRSAVEKLLPEVKEIFRKEGIAIADEHKLEKVIDLVKERCILLTDFVHQSIFFFETPATIHIETILPKWNDVKNLFFTELVRNYSLANFWKAEELEHSFKEIASVNRLKPGELMLPFRIMLVGDKYGPGIFEIAYLLGRDETIKRVQHTLNLLAQTKS